MYTNKQATNFTSLSADEFEQALSQPNMQIVDVRTPDEYFYGHISDSMNMNVTAANGSFELEIQTLNKQHPVAVYCQGGVRSKIAAHTLVVQGFSVVELDGGMYDWLASEKPVEE